MFFIFFYFFPGLDQGFKIRFAKMEKICYYSILDDFLL